MVIFLLQFSFKEGLCWFDNITLVMQRLRLPCSKLSCCVLSFKKRLVFFKATFFPTMFRLSIVAKSKYTKVIHCLDLTLLTVSSNVYYFNLKLVWYFSTLILSHHSNVWTVKAGFSNHCLSMIPLLTWNYQWNFIVRRQNLVWAMQPSKSQE